MDVVVHEADSVGQARLEALEQQLSAWLLLRLNTDSVQLRGRTLRGLRLGTVVGWLAPGHLVAGGQSETTALAPPIPTPRAARLRCRHA